MTYRYTPTDPFDITTHHFMVLMFNEIVLFYDSLAFHKEVVLIKRSLTRLVEVCGSRSKLAGTGLPQSELRILVLDTRQFDEFRQLNCIEVFPEHRVQWEERERKTGEWGVRLMKCPDLCWQSNPLSWPKPLSWHKPC